jgi:hypothetical protein
MRPMVTYVARKARHRRIALATAVLCIGINLPAASAAPLALDFTGGQTGTCHILSGLEGCSLGWTFSVNAPIVVDGLGLWDEGSDGMNESHDVALFDSTSALLASTTISSASTHIASSAVGGRWLFQAIAPTMLAPGTYLIDAFYFINSPDLFRSNAASSTIPQITFLGNNSAASDEVGPGSSTFAPFNDAYFGPTFSAVPATVPEPSTIFLLVTGLAGVSAKFRRRASQFIARDDKSSDGAADDL